MYVIIDRNASIFSLSLCLPVQDVSSVRLSNDSFFTIATDDANSHKNRDNFNLPCEHIDSSNLNCI